MPGISINVAKPYNVSDYVPIYGMYCGPGWTGGQRGGNDLTIPPVDAIDLQCQIHDKQYANAAATYNPAEAIPLYTSRQWFGTRTKKSLTFNALPEGLVNLS
ncbi:hypothetical protein, partial [Rugamonas rubra]